VQHLGRADAVDELDDAARGEALGDLGRQRLTGRRREPQRDRGAGQQHQRREHPRLAGGRAEEDGRLHAVGIAQRLRLADEAAGVRPTR